MAKVARTMSAKSPLSGKARGGKLALFEVLRNGGEESAEAAPTPVAVEAPIPRAAVSRSVGGGGGGGGGGRSLAPLATLIAVAAIVTAGVFSYGLLRNGNSTQASVVPDEVMPEVLDVSTPESRVALQPADQTLASVGTPTQRTVATPPVIREQQVFADSVSRTNGLNYVLVQSYHASEEDRAVATLQALAESGIHATLEHDIPGWPKRICIVGVVGFERINNNPELRDYMDRLESVSDKHRNDRKVKLFDPRPVHWTRS